MLVNKENRVALVTGANGITGAYLVAQLASEPQWSRVVATSRSQPRSLPENDLRIHFAQCDLATDADTISRTLEAAGATGITHFFHMAYIHDDTFEKQYEYNRVVLQTGAKHYGVGYKAPPPGPIVEDLGRSGSDGPPNFYYPQEDFMFALQEGKRWTWNVTRPFAIHGFTFASGQSYATTAALYFSIQKYLGEEAIFPLPVDGDSAYDKRWDVSSATNIAAFTTYMSVHPEAGNKDYNIVDNDPAGITFGELWEDMGNFFGVPVTKKAGFDVSQDVEEKVKRGVWNEIAAKNGVAIDACENYGTWYFFQWCMASLTWPCHVSMEKAKREIGWSTRCDSRKEMRKIFDNMREARIIP